MPVRLARTIFPNYRPVLKLTKTHYRSIQLLIDYPWPGRRGVHVEAVALYLAKHDGTPIPVIDGTLEKLTSYRIANKLAQELRIPLIEMGKGFA